jgi:hypothetical protein
MGPIPLRTWRQQITVAEVGQVQHLAVELGDTNLMPGAGRSFQFISIQNPAEAKDGGKRRLARSHAVRQALLNRRRPEEEMPRAHAVASGQTLTPWSAFVSPSVYGPFETIFGDSPRLRALLSHGKHFRRLIRPGLIPVI